MNRQTLPASIAFDDATLNIIDRDGTPWLAAADLARALGYGNPRAVSGIYAKHVDEFGPGMSTVLETSTASGMHYQQRIFSPRGCHLIAMFSRTPRASVFRRWVLDVLEGLAVPRPAAAVVSADFMDPAHRMRAWAKATECGTKAVPAAQIPAELLDGVIADMLFGQRWLVYFDNRLSMGLQQVPSGAMVFDPKDPKSVALLVNEHLPRDQLLPLAQLALTRAMRLSPEKGKGTNVGTV